MLNHKQMVLAVGAAVMVSTLAMVPRDAHAWQAFGYQFPIDIIERLWSPGHKAPTLDAAAGRAKTVKAGQRTTVSLARSTTR